MDLEEFLNIHNMTKAAFSRLIGISPMHLSNICNGWKNPSLHLIKQIEKATNGSVSMDDLFNPNAPSRLKSRRKKKTIEEIKT